MEVKEKRLGETFHMNCNKKMRQSNANILMKKARFASERLPQFKCKSILEGPFQGPSKERATPE